MPVERPSSKGWGNRYAQVVKTSGKGSYVHLAGQTAAPMPGSSETQEISTMGCKAQTSIILTRIDRLLAEQGASKSDLVRAWVFLHDPKDVHAANAAWDEWMNTDGNLPARTNLVASPQLHTPDSLVEITVDAFVNAPENSTMDTSNTMPEPPTKVAKTSARPEKFCCVFLGSSNGNDPIYHADAYKFGRLLAESGIGLVYGGANGGLMGALADGVLEHSKGYAIGVIPEGNVVPSEHRHAQLSEMIMSPNMPERKKTMLDKADFLVALPGGTGTLDELTEVVDFKKLGLHSKPVFALNTKGFWKHLYDMMKHMESSGFSRTGSTEKLLQLADTPEELVNFLSSAK